MTLKGSSFPKGDSVIGRSSKGSPTPRCFLLRPSGRSSGFRDVLLSITRNLLRFLKSRFNMELTTSHEHGKIFRGSATVHVGFTFSGSGSWVKEGSPLAGGRILLVRPLYFVSVRRVRRGPRGPTLVCPLRVSYVLVS